MVFADDAQFYTGLVAELYEPLANDLASAEPFKRFVSKYGTPALELACGAGHPMLDLLAEGLQVHGLDSSQDMLNLCLGKARELGLDEPTVSCQRMQDFSLPDHYPCCYVAGASFCLLTDLQEARRALSCVHRHLLPGGRFLLSGFRPEPLGQNPPVKRRRSADGSIISVRAIAQSEDRAAQTVATLLRYTRERPDQEIEVVDREWRTRWYTVDEMHEHLHKAGFEVRRCTDFEGLPVNSDATDFVVTAVSLAAQ